MHDTRNKKYTGSTLMATPEMYENPNRTAYRPTRMSSNQNNNRSPRSNLHATGGPKREGSALQSTLECILAGDLPQPTALQQCPDWAQQTLESEVSTAVKNLR